MRVEPKYQKLTVRKDNTNIIELKNENSLSTYISSDEATIILENLSSSANQDHSHTDDFVCKTDVSIILRLGKVLLSSVFYLEIGSARTYL